MNVIISTLSEKTWFRWSHDHLWSQLITYSVLSGLLFPPLSSDSFSGSTRETGAEAGRVKTRGEGVLIFMEPPPEASVLADVPTEIVGWVRERMTSSRLGPTEAVGERDVDPLEVDDRWNILPSLEADDFRFLSPGTELIELLLVGSRITIPISDDPGGLCVCSPEIPEPSVGAGWVSWR